MGYRFSLVLSRIITDDEAMNHLTGIIRKKYGLQFRLLVGVERLFRSGQAQRVLLKITPSG